MARVSYTAQRSLKAGVSAGTAVDFDFNVSDLDRYTKTARSDRASLGGLRQVLRDRTDVGYRVQTLPVLEADFDDFRQFLDSVDGGEAFTFDPYGTLASPVSPATSILVSTGYRERRVSQRYLATNFDIEVAV